MNAMTPIVNNELIGRLPENCGAYIANAPLRDLTWFRVGGPAEVLYRPRDIDDLMIFMAHRPKDVPVTVLGVGSNLLVRDGGVPGIVIRLGRGFSGFELVDGASLDSDIRFRTVDLAPGAKVIRAGAGLSDVSLAMKARDAGVAGLEFLRGIPGTVGGAVRMNAGAYGREMKDVLLAVRWIDDRGILRWNSIGELEMGYRSSAFPEIAIITEALFRAEPGERDAIDARMKQISEARNLSQPVKSSTGGSTFANPPGARAWELIDAAGCRGLVVGDAQVSEQHCNFLINRGNATAADLETLGETVRRRVAESSGVELHWEIRRIGVPAGGDA